MPPPILQCNTCFRPLPSGEGDGRCPACLLAAAFEEPEADTIGELGGHDLLEEIARGGMGVVYRARQREPEREVALKAILGGWLSAPEVRERFRLEARAMAALEHPAILPVYQFGEQDQVPFFTMKLADGGTLTGRLAAFTGKWREIAALMVTVAEAVQFAHERGVLHRDLKPGNILFDAEGRVFVSDFGMAKLLDEDSDMTQSASVLGTPHYLAPEIATNGATSATTASDQWSLGVILYELLAQARPFAAVAVPALMREISEKEPPPLSASIPRDLAIIVMKSLSKKPADRYSSVRAMAADLGRWLRNEPILARPRSWYERALTWCRRYPAVATLGFLLVTGALGGAAILLHVNRNLTAAVHDKDLSRQVAEARLQESLQVEADAILLSDQLDASERALEIVAQLQALGAPALEVRNLAVWALATPGAHETAALPSVFASDGSKLAYSPDFHWYATSRSGADGFRLHSTKPGEVPRDFITAGRPSNFRFSRDGAWLAMKLRPSSRGAGCPLLVRRMDDPAHEIFQTQVEGDHWVLPLDFHPAGRHWLYSRGDASVRRHQIAAPVGVEDEVVLTAPGPVQGITFSPTGSQLALKWDGGIGVVDVATGEWRWQRIGECNTDWPIWNPAGTRVGVGVNQPYRFAMFNAATGEETVACFGHTSRISMAEFHPSLPLVATVAWDHQVVLWDTGSGLPLARSAAMVRGVGFSADGTQMAFSPAFRGTSVFAFKPQSVWRAWEGDPLPGSSALGVDLSPDGRWLLSNWTGQIRLWDVANRKAVTTLSLPDNIRAGTSFWLDGSHLIHGEPSTTQANARLLVLDDIPDEASNVPKLKTIVPVPFYWITGRTADRTHLLCTTSNGQAAEFNPDQSLGLTLPAWGQQLVRDIAPGDRWAVCAAGANKEGRTFEVRQIKDGTIVHSIREPASAQTKFSPDGKSLVLAGSDRTVVWETETWREIARWPVQMTYENTGGISFSPDGKLAAVRLSEGVLDLRETSRWTRLALLRAPGATRQNGGQFRAIWTADSQRILVLTESSRIHEWDLPILRAELRKLHLDWDDP